MLKISVPLQQRRFQNTGWRPAHTTQRGGNPDASVSLGFPFVKLLCDAWNVIPRRSSTKIEVKAVRTC